MDLYNKKNGQYMEFMYPKHGNMNILRTVRGYKQRSFTGRASGLRGAVVQEVSGAYRSFNDIKAIPILRKS